jgi:hypothetical protein
MVILSFTGIVTSPVKLIFMGNRTDSETVEKLTTGRNKWLTEIPATGIIFLYNVRHTTPVFKSKQEALPAKLPSRFGMVELKILLAASNCEPNVNSFKTNDFETIPGCKPKTNWLLLINLYN